jgi:hypothetical protein
MNIKSFLVFSALGLALAARADWQQFRLGHGGDQMTTLWSGKGRNDNVERIYAACFNGHIYEFSKEHGQWITRDIGSAPDLMTYTRLGPGRNDGVNRVYGSSNDYNVYEFTYDPVGDRWLRVCLGGGTTYMNAVVVGQGRNDGVDRVYSADWAGHVHEFTWSGGNWVHFDLGTGGTSYLCDVAVGPGRGDGVNRVYASSYSGPLLEHSFENGSWVVRTVGSVGVLQAVSVGKGRKDSQLCDTLDHVYAGSMDGNAYEFIYCNGSWTRTLMGTTVGGIYSTLALGKTKSTDDDNRNALYAGTDQGRVYEFVYKNNAWQMNLVGVPGVHIDGVCAGKNPDVASDDKDLIYAASYDSWVYGYDYDKAGTGVSGSEFVKGVVFVPLKTPGSPPLAFSLRIPGPFPEHVSLIIVDASGRMIQTLYDGVAIPGNRVIRWNGCDASGRRVPVGVYLAHLRTGQTSLTCKFLIIR